MSAHIAELVACDNEGGVRLTAASGAHALVDDPGDITSSAIDFGDLFRSTNDIGDLFFFTYSLSRNALLQWSAGAPDLLGSSFKDVALDGNLFLRHVHEEDRFFVLNALEQTIRQKIPLRITYRWIRPDTNVVRWLNCRARVEHLSSTMEDAMVGVVSDITRELSFASSGAELVNPLAVLDSLPSLVIAMDHECRVLRKNGNNHVERLAKSDLQFEVSKLEIGSALLDGIKNQPLRQHWERSLSEILDGTRPRFSARAGSPEGHLALEFIPLVRQGGIEGIVLSISDATATVDLERRVGSLQRSEGLRRVAAGATHHLNNALQSILGHAATIISRSEEGSFTRAASESIISLAERASHFTHEMLALDESHSRSLGAVDLNLIVMSALNRVEGLFVAPFKVTVDFGNPALVACSQSDLLGAVEKLIRSGAGLFAPDAGSVESELTVKTVGQNSDAESYSSVVVAASSPRGLLGEFLESDEIHLTLERSAEAAGARLTKEIVRNGLSQPIEARFALTFKGQSRPPLDMTTEEHSLQGKGKILVVDDDVMVLETVCAVLKGAGYDCYGASDANRALELASEHREEISLIMVDAVMPGMSTSALVRKLKKLKESCTVVGFSGAAPEHAAPLIEAGASTIIQKPIDPRALKARLDDLLAARTQERR